ncbi:MAG: type II toxin-antitoxin system RelE/ParE family toxin [Pseudohongiella sp.]|nr:type II toxin-antitoxin system RelE/ParE family toxin [Pseudohongiella sp.]
MIISFRCKDTQKLAEGLKVRRFTNIERAALRKIRQLQIAGSLDDLRIPPGNRLQSMSGDRVGQYSIRINDQYCLCFLWNDGNAEDVELIDYH